MSFGGELLKLTNTDTGSLNTGDIQCIFTVVCESTSGFNIQLLIEGYFFIMSVLI